MRFLELSPYGRRTATLLSGGAYALNQRRTDILVARLKLKGLLQSGGNLNCLSGDSIQMHRAQAAQHMGGSRARRCCAGAALIPAMEAYKLAVQIKIKASRVPHLDLQKRGRHTCAVAALGPRARRPDTPAATSFCLNRNCSSFLSCSTPVNTPFLGHLDRTHRSLALASKISQ